jgi:hypothetical protein
LGHSKTTGGSVATVMEPAPNQSKNPKRARIIVLKVVMSGFTGDPLSLCPTVFHDSWNLPLNGSRQIGCRSVLVGSREMQDHPAQERFMKRSHNSTQLFFPGQCDFSKPPQPQIDQNLTYSCRMKIPEADFKGQSVIPAKAEI